MSDGYKRPSVYARYSRGGQTAAEAAARVGVSRRTAQRWTSDPRDKWINDQFERREAIRVYHDDQHHSWPETGDHFDITASTAKKLAYRARKESAREAEEAARGPMLPGFEHE